MARLLPHFETRIRLSYRKAFRSALSGAAVKRASMQFSRFKQARHRPLARNGLPGIRLFPVELEIGGEADGRVGVT
jgi:hypothetical protein